MTTLASFCHALLSPPSQLSITVNHYSATYGSPIVVQITGNYQPVISSFLMLDQNIPINATSMMNSEAN